MEKENDTGRAVELAAGKDTPALHGAKKFFSLLFPFFGRLLYANLLFVLLCLPVVTIPCALSGLLRVTGSLCMLGHTDVLRDFFSEFRARFLSKTLVGLLLLALPTLMIYGIFMAFGVAAAFGAGVLILLVFFLLQCYLYAYVAMVDLPIGKQLNNALLSLLSMGKRDALLLLPAAFTALMVLLLPYALPVILLIGCAATALMVIVILEDAIRDITK